MKKGFEKFVKSVVDFVYKNFEKHGSGNMLLITAITGFTLSTLAQTGAIIANKKYSASEKAFMIPQELTEGLINIFSMFMITKPLQKLAKSYTKSGKILSNEMKEYLQEMKLIDKRGQADFNLRKTVISIIKDIEKSDKFIRASKIEQNELLSKHKDILEKHDGIEDAVSAIVTTAGGILSATIIAPYLRNTVAANYQRVNMNAMNRHEDIKRQLLEYQAIQRQNPVGNITI